MNLYLAIVLFSLILAYLMESLGQILNISALDPCLPKEFRDACDETKYQKSQVYTKSKTRLNLITSSVNLVLLLGFILLGGFPWLDSLVRSLGLPFLGSGLVFVAILILAQDLLNEPFELYQIFVLEEKFGFNRTGLGTYLSDKLKALFLMLVIGGPVLAGVLLFFKYFADWVWLYVWGLTIFVVVVLQYLAPTWILPLFNKFTPLEQGDLKKKILDYAQNVGFDLSGIYVLDGSKRSSKSNAFFTGFGKKKCIALYDTLIEKHDPQELVCVLAHEVGHYKLRHILKNLFLFIVKSGIILWIMSFFISYPPLFEAFGMQKPSVYAGLVFFALLYTPISVIFSIFMNFLSRKHEYQADRFAANTTGDTENLIRALKRLAVDNLSNLTPHPFYVFLQYSHPPVLERIRALRQ